MIEQTAPVAAEDAAWASVNTPSSVEALKAFCLEDVERLFRINPMLEFSKWEKIGEGRYHFAGKNISQETPFQFDIELQVTPLADGLQVDYTGGIKSSTIFKIEAGEQGAKLTIIDRYDGLSEADRQQHLGEVDKSIITWAHYLQRYLLDWQRWSRFGLWRWYMRRVWQPMKPMARRITYILLWITVVEIALIMLGAAIYFIEFT